MLSPKAKLLLRESKKELLRYATLKTETSPGIFIQSHVNNLSFHFSWRELSVDNKTCHAEQYLRTVWYKWVKPHWSYRCNWYVCRFMWSRDVFESEFSPRMSYTSLQLLTLVVSVHALLGLHSRILYSFCSTAPHQWHSDIVKLNVGQFNNDFSTKLPAILTL